MKKFDFLAEDKVYQDEISKYFNDVIPINFKKLVDEYNIEIGSVDFEVIKQSLNIKKINIAGMNTLENDIIKIYYNNNQKYNTKEQRFIIASLIANTENKKNDFHGGIKDYDLMIKCDLPFDDMNQEEFDYCVDNKLARQILMPKEQFKNIIFFIENDYSFNRTMKILSDYFVVPEREVKIRCAELGYLNEDNFFKKNNEEKKHTFLKNLKMHNSK